MKKLLAMVASALTLGAFADAGRAPITFANLDIAEGDEVSFVCGENPIQTITVDASMAKFRSITISTEGLDVGSYSLAKGDAKTEGLTVANTASAPQFSVSGFISSQARRLHWVKTNADNNEWNASTTALVEGTEDKASITKTDTLVVDADFDKALYLNACPARNYEIAGGEVHVSHAGVDGQNFPSGSAVKIADDATLVLRRWNRTENVSGGGAYKVNIDGVTFVGGTVKVVEHAAEVNGQISGNATIDVSSVALSAIKDKLTFADSWVGTIKLPVIDAIAGNNAAHNLDSYGNANSKIALAGINAGWLTRGIDIKPTLVLEGDVKINDWSQDSYTFAAIEGTGNFSVVKEGAYAPNSVVIKKIDALKYTGSIKAGVNLTINTLETNLEAVPVNKAKVLSLAEGTDVSKITVTVKLADGTAIDAENVFVESDGIYVGPKASSVPGIDLIPEGEKTEYEVWAAANGIAADPEMSEEQAAAYASNCAIAFHLGASVSEGVTIEDAAQAKVEELVAKIDCSKLAGGDGLNAALETLNDELAEKGLVASLKPVELEGASESTKLYQLVITLKPEN